ncbi:MAG: hypothetical protein DRQ54_08140 [Gammaproteobacteria bacterium]|nr:MAG: hypothetical protein DRQ54_08140 [Gammaproteobacteria bacterium]RLA12737.1 MAG: hypothetical protein DRQ52_07460 [Gammaproteobacteria bacterium]
MTTIDIHSNRNAGTRVRANQPTPSLLSGRREDTLRVTSDGLRLAVRTVHMDQPVIDAPNFAFLF